MSLHRAGDVTTGAWQPVLKGVAVTQCQMAIAKWKLLSDLLIKERNQKSMLLFF